MRPLRIALLSYRSKPHSGGQGIYVRHLSRALVAAGHQVTVFSGQPYPELDPGVELVRLPSLDLFRDEDPFRLPHPRELRDGVDALEVAGMLSAGFPEPMTFSLRAARELATRGSDFDVIHDNQSLGWGLLRLQSVGAPVVATIHHPISMDRRIELDAATTWRRRLSLHRWYGFVRMQATVARRLPHLVTVSRSSARDIVRDFGVRPEQLHVVPLGVQPEVFAPPADGSRVPGRIVATASADTPLKGLPDLLRAFARVRQGRHTSLHVVTRPTPGGPTERLVTELGLDQDVTFSHGLSVEQMAAAFGSGEIVCVPSLYEGFSLPTLEAMACGMPLVVSDGGAIPEVVGTPGVCADVVPAGDVDRLASALGAMLDDPARRARMGAAARERAVREFAWSVVAERMTQVYESAIADARRRD